MFSRIITNFTISINSGKVGMREPNEAHCEKKLKGFTKGSEQGFRTAQMDCNFEFSRGWGENSEQSQGCFLSALMISIKK